MACIIKKHHLKVPFKDMQFVALFIFHMGKTRMQVKSDLRYLRQKIQTKDTRNTEAIIIINKAIFTRTAK